MEKWLINRRKGVFYITEAKVLFEELYIDVRTKENRLLEDEIVVQLPRVSSDHPHHEEWKKRQATCAQFIHHLKQHPPKTALDIGCGNGWFTHQISTIATSTFGLDVGTEELEQAARCFANESTKFVCCTDWSLLPDNTFDLITFNASLQYFELNEAFASQSIAVIREAGLNPDIVNVNGGALALGHPLGCSGAKLTVQIMNELKRRNKKYGVVTMCIGTGQGAAGVIEMC